MEWKFLNYLTRIYSHTGQKQNTAHDTFIIKHKYLFIDKAWIQIIIYCVLSNSVSHITMYLR